MKYRESKVALLGLSILLSSGTAHAFNTHVTFDRTHEAITLKALDLLRSKYPNDPEYQIMYDGVVPYNAYYGNQGGFRLVIAGGSDDLDINELVPPSSFQSINYHYYDQIDATTPSAYDEAVSPFWNTQWFKKAIERYRAGGRPDAYYILGYTAHLIEDMGVPAHAYNIPHGPILAPNQNLGVEALRDAKRDNYENIVTANLVNTILPPSVLSSLSLSSRPSLRSYFDDMVNDARNVPHAGSFFTAGEYLIDGTPSGYDQPSMSDPRYQVMANELIPKTVAWTASMFKWYHDIVHKVNRGDLC